MQLPYSRKGGLVALEFVLHKENLMVEVGDRIRIVAGSGTDHWFADGSTVTVTAPPSQRHGMVAAHGRLMADPVIPHGVQLLYADEYEVLK